MKIIFESEQEKSEYLLCIIHLLNVFFKLPDKKEAAQSADSLVMMTNNIEVKPSPDN